MKSSSLSPQPTTPVLAPRRNAATGEIWEARDPASSGIAFAVAITGADPVTVTELATLSAATSDEAADLLTNVELLARTLTATVESHSERCIHSLRGPVQWSETITARANALGNEDVYVCATSARSFNTVENRVLVVALAAVAGAAAIARGPAAELLSPEQLEVVAERAEQAKRWLALPRLRDIPRKRLTPKELTQFRNSRRGSWMRTVADFRARQQRCFGTDLVVLLCDDRTLDLHRFVVDTVNDIRTFESIPSGFRVADGGIESGRLTFRHPAAAGTAIPGLSYRGIPLVPPAVVLGDAPWAADLPARGLRVNGRSDIERLLRQLAPNRAARR